MTKKRFKKFRKIPVVIEAYQTDVEIEIETLEGTMKADKGDWIIRGVKGEFYPCKPDVFEMTYEKVDWMTENKRFYRVGGYVYDRDKFISHYRDEIVTLLNELHEENKQLKAQLYCDDEEGVCNICKHHYLEKGETYEKYYISKCKKGHEKCSKMDLKYCDDFELKEGDV